MYVHLYFCICIYIYRVKYIQGVSLKVLQGIICSKSSKGNDEIFFAVFMASWGLLNDRQITAPNFLEKARKENMLIL